jgi:signal transduction histidine kinase
LSYRDTFSAFSGIVEDKDLVESYTPIRGRNGRIEGVFELYADVTPLVVGIGHKTTELAVILLLFFGLMFGCLFLIVERADLSEERYRELFDDSPVAIWEEDWSPIKQMLDDLARGGVEDWPGYFNSHRDQLRAAYDLAKITEVSRATVDIYGAASKEELLRWSTSASVIDDELDAFRETILSFLAGQMTVDIESKDTTVGESEIMVRRRVIIPPKYFNDWSRVIYAIEDDTERKRAEEALLVSEHALQKRVADLEGARRKLELQGESLVCLTDDLLIARDEARAADRAKSEFLAAMSHELRTPLNAIIGFSEIIKNETFGPVGSLQYREYTRDIHESGQHLLTLINDVLDLSKIDSGAAELHEDEISIAEAVRAVLKLVGHRAEQRGFKIELKLEDQLPALRADERKLKQILVNLLSNAVKFTDAGGEVTLRAWCRMDSGHVFQIVDTGIGIAPEDIPKALSRFRQVDSDLDRRFEGTGLGLPLTKDLVELHGGSLDLQSEVGVGTTVTVRLPAERIVALPDDTQSLDRAARKAS